MGTLLQLLSTSFILSELSEAAEESGFGLNFSILETNLLNLAIIIGVLFYFGRKVVGNILVERRSQIETAIQDAEQRRQAAVSALAEQQQNLAQAQAEAARIRESATQNAEKAKQDILAQADQDVERMKAAAVQDLNSQQERVINELRQRAVAMAMQRVEERLKNELNDDTKRNLVDRSIALIGGQS